MLEAQRLCMSVRGVRARGSNTVTSALPGQLRDDPRSRQKFFRLIEISRAPAATAQEKQ